MKNFEDKTVWITGASSGIGKALAVAFAEEGARIILSGRRVDALQTVADALPTAYMILPFDVTDFHSLRDLVDQAWAWAELSRMILDQRQGHLQAALLQACFVKTYQYPYSLYIMIT